MLNRHLEPVTDHRPSTSLLTYVIDTSVLLSDPKAILRFAEHKVVLPLVVIEELEAKRHHPELGYFARSALRLLDDLRVMFDRLDEPLVINASNGTLQVELRHSGAIPTESEIHITDNDSRILAVALLHQRDGEEVVLVSKDLPLRVKASALGLKAEEYRAEQPIETGWSGMVELDVADDIIDQLYQNHTAEISSIANIPIHAGLILHGSNSSALARKLPDGSASLINHDRDVFGIRGRSAEQRVALELLLDDSIGIVSLGGRAGTGKSALALCAGLEQTLEQRKYSKVIVFRPLYAVGGQELGYLPGTQGEKMNPWGQAVMDTLESVTNKYVIDELIAQDMIEVLPLTHIRGRSLHDAFVIVDETQSLERNVLLTVLSRIGQNSRVVLTHDIAQRDNLRVGRHDGIVAVIEKLKNHPLFAHVLLTRPERSPIAALVTEMLDADELG